MCIGGERVWMICSNVWGKKNLNLLPRIWWPRLECDFDMGSMGHIVKYPTAVGNKTTTDSVDFCCQLSGWLFMVHSPLRITWHISISFWDSFSWIGEWTCICWLLMPHKCKCVWPVMACQSRSTWTFGDTGRERRSRWWLQFDLSDRPTWDDWMILNG